MSDRRTGMGSHQSQAMVSESWLTPPEILAALGEFDLDPACPPNMPWQTAAEMLTEVEDGLVTPWRGRVFLNPPYNRKVEVWMRRLVAHGCGTALVFARTETEWFVNTVWKAADAAFFFYGRLHFHHVDGTRAINNGGAPSCLVAYGEGDAAALRNCKLDGKFVELR